ncbi:uncharacterized protein LOC143152551 isoform X3 [Ptiloglossa arizonensis]|uniref:uncharacterized protein LOC143152551 isoform X3 n=1 Tax=Ptiloglossa arizonensis TaxID=3350558 RepID=UPI003F9FD814
MVQRVARSLQGWNTNIGASVGNKYVTEPNVREMLKPICKVKVKINLFRAGALEADFEKGRLPGGLSQVSEVSEHAQQRINLVVPSPCCIPSILRQPMAERLRTTVWCLRRGPDQLLNQRGYIDTNTSLFASSRRRNNKYRTLRFRLFHCSAMARGIIEYRFRCSASSIKDLFEVCSFQGGLRFYRG